MQNLCKHIHDEGDLAMYILNGNSVSKHLRGPKTWQTTSALYSYCHHLRAHPNREGPVRLTKEVISRDLDCWSLRPPGETVLAWL